MGIGSNLKSMLGNDNVDAEDASRLEQSRSFEEPRDTNLTKTSSRLTNSNRAARLPSGTGPGTSGKGDSSAFDTGDLSRYDSELAAERDLHQQHTNIEGYGTDAAAAVGGSLSNTHTANTGRISGDRTRDDRGSFSGGSHSSNTRNLTASTSASGPTADISSKRASQAARDSIQQQRGETLPSGLAPTTTLSNISESSEIGRSGGRDVRIVHEHETTERTYDLPNTGGDQRYTSGSGERRTGVLSEYHQFGHGKHNSRDSMPTANAEEDTNQLAPVTHERVRHLEREEVARVKEIDRHIHHIQHHTQPVLASEELVEQIREHVVPVTTVRETHANKAEDSTLFEGQVHQYHDTLTHNAKERTVIDKGTTVNERVHHHVHHVIQPVIEKETIDKQTIRTTIPIHEITHEAPVVHQSQTHAPVPLEHFLSRGGTLSGATSQDVINKKVLTTGQCKREVDGVAETLERELKLGTAEKVTSSVPHKKVMETDEQLRTTVVPVGQN